MLVEGPKVRSVKKKKKKFMQTDYAKCDDFLPVFICSRRVGSVKGSVIESMFAHVIHVYPMFEGLIVCMFDNSVSIFSINVCIQ